ncbi:hypothetical protein [Collinsella aerofaciens]|uniref:hypothetical protein n=1 Tax=Collinsella aerofaciens TaxID=74426 RepID=UPI001278B787|nr:hypothetical protein [Collinsella aerofaciens]VWL64163.1 Uncharacterised protein [Collinsella aerofaciens]
MAAVEPGDHVIAEWPSYTPLYEIPRTLGAEVEYWELLESLRLLGEALAEFDR